MVNYDFVHDGTELAVAEMIKSGTTCFADQYFFCEAAADVVAKTGIRACLGIPILGAWRLATHRQFVARALMCVLALPRRDRFSDAARADV